MKIISVLFLLTGSACVSLAPSEQAQQYMDAGDEYYQRGEHQDAMESYDRAVQAHSRTAEAYFRRGNTHLRIARDPEGEGLAREHENQALVNYRRCLQIDPAHGRAYYNRAMIWIKRGMPRDAVKDLLRYARMQSKDPEPHYLIGWLYEEKFEDNSMLIRAMGHYEKFLELGGRNKSVRTKVENWKKLKAASGAAPQPEQPSSTLDEKKAQFLFDQWRSHFESEDREAARKVIAELLEKYGHTGVVAERHRQLEILLRTLTPKEPKKSPDNP